MRKNRATNWSPRQRVAGAIVEMALTLPILVLIALAAIDTCKVLLLRQSAKIAAFECARAGIVPGVTRAQLERLCHSFMSSRSISSSRLNLSVEDLQKLEKGQLLTATVSVPADNNTLAISWFYRNQVFDETVTIMVDR